MIQRDALGPFQAGPGRMPPYLAGRRREQALFRALLQRLRDGVSLPGEVILYGPRGNGKTVLLGWLEDEAASMKRVETLVLLPADVRDVGRLGELLLAKSWWDRLTPRQIAVAGIPVRPGKGNTPSPSLDGVLAARVRRAPLLLVMDEAHTLDLEVGRALLNASQRVGRKHPFLLVLAGTPQLRGHLGAMGASFWNRARKLRLDRLDDPAAAEAFRRPFAAEGIRVPDEVLAEMVRRSHGYPYFVQLLGEKVWAAMGAVEGDLVTRAAFGEALAAFADARGDYYLDRFAELREHGLLAVARAVAEAFQGREFLAIHEVEEAIRAALADPADDQAERRAERTLADLGFIWGTSPAPGWEPGIPSLMDYVVEFAPRP